MQLQTAMEEIPNLSKKDRKKVFSVYEVYPEDRVPRKKLKKLVSPATIAFLYRVPKSLAKSIKEDTSFRKTILAWFYKNKKPSIGWPRFRRPFPTSRREKVMYSRLGMFPRVMVHVVDGTHLVCPNRTSLAYSESQFWLWYEWQVLKGFLLDRPFLIPEIVGTTIPKYFKRVLTALDHLGSPGHSAWYTAVQRDQYYLRRVARRSKPGDPPDQGKL